MPYASIPSDYREDFRCRLCGCNRYVLISAQREGGYWYDTPFFKCCGCSVMFEDPLDFAGLRLYAPGTENYLEYSRPDHKPMIRSVPNPFLPDDKKKRRG